MDYLEWIKNNWYWIGPLLPVLIGFIAWKFNIIIVRLPKIERLIIDEHSLKNLINEKEMYERILEGQYKPGEGAIGEKEYHNDIVKFKGLVAKEISDDFDRYLEYWNNQRLFQLSEDRTPKIPGSGPVVFSTVRRSVMQFAESRRDDLAEKIRKRRDSL